MIVLVLATGISPNRLLLITGVGSLFMATVRGIAIVVVIIFMIGQITVPMCQLPVCIFQIPATQCLHCPPNVILSTPKRDHDIDIFPNSCSTVDLGYRTMLRAMLWEWIQGLRNNFVEWFGALGRSDNWECPPVVPYFLNLQSAGLLQPFADYENGLCLSQRHVILIASSESRYPSTAVRYIPLPAQ